MLIAVSLDGNRERNITLTTGEVLSITLAVYEFDGDAAPIDSARITNARLLVGDQSGVVFGAGSTLLLTAPDSSRTCYRLLAEVDGITRVLAEGMLIVNGGCRSSCVAAAAISLSPGSAMVIPTTGVPANTAGTNGWYAIDFAAGVYYSKVLGAWGAATLLPGAGGGGGSTALANNLTTTALGFALDARQGPAITTLIGGKFTTPTGTTGQYVRGDGSLATFPAFGTVTSVGLTGPAAGLTVTGATITTSGSFTLALANDLAAVEGLASTGIVRRTAADTWSAGTAVSLTAEVSGLLPLVSGGTGTSTPALVAGSNVTISGAWPNQTINSTAAGGGGGTVTATAGALTLNAVMLGAGGSDSKVLASLGTVSTVLHGNAAGAPTFGAVALGTDVSGILAVANGGNGTATPALVAGANIAISGTWPAQTVAFSGLLPVASGGTGTATPGIVAGTNVTVSGTWPNQTVNSTAGGSGTVTATAGALTANALVVGNGGTDEKVLASLGTTTTVLHGNAAGLPTFGAVALASDVSGLLPIANGGTGTASPGIVAGANVTVTGTWPNQTVAAGKPSILSVAASRDLATGDLGNLLVCSTGTAAVALNIVSGLGIAGDVIFFRRSGANALTVTVGAGATLRDPYTLQGTAIPDFGEGFIQCESAGVWIRYA